MVCQPQYVLFCDSRLSLPVSSDGNCEPLVGLGQWHFVLERLDGSEGLEAMDSEPQIHRDRIALLAAVRGLEALEHPSHVRLMTTSRYVDRGMRFGLPNWRDANYRWESFGALRPIRNSDLWQRISSAMQYHEISCRLLSAGSELAESIIVRQRKLLGTDRQEPNSPSESRSNRLVTHAKSNLSCLSSVASRSVETKTNRPKLPVKRQWWDMASLWEERAQCTAAMAQ